MRLPAIPHIRIGWRLASFLVAGLLIFGLYQLWNAPLYRVNDRSVEIHGLQRLSDSAVRTVLAAENKPVFSLDTQSMQENLVAAFPEFSSAVVSIELPNTVVVTVTERVPVLIWHQDGHTSLIDVDGMLFPLRDESVQTNYPVVEAVSSPPAPISLTLGDEQSVTSDSLFSQGMGEKPGNVLNLSSTAAGLSGIALESARPFMFPEMVSAILSLAGKAPEGAVITYDATHGLGWKDRRGWEVYFGDILETKNGDIEMKLHVYKSILEYLKAQDTKPALISVEYVHAPYYRLAGESGD
jgi:cell division protein FtsQ